MTDDASSLETFPSGAGLIGLGPSEGEPAGLQSPQADGPTTPEPAYAAVEEWVTGYFLPMFRRTLGGEFRWCAQWWRHGEAISRLSSLWHSWEALRLRPGTGIATWYRDYLDHQLPILMGARGPFYQCSETAHRDPREAAATPAPAEWWDTEAADAALPDDMLTGPVAQELLGSPGGHSQTGQDDDTRTGEGRA